MSDLVERLRQWSVFGYGYEASCTMKEAATAIEEQRVYVANAARLLSEQTAEIEQLEAEGDKARARGDNLRMALEDIAYGDPLHNENDMMRIARAALEAKP